MILALEEVMVGTGQGGMNMVVASKGLKKEGEQECVFGKKGQMIYIFYCSGSLLLCCSKLVFIGHREEALTAIEECVELYRSLAKVYRRLLS